MALPLFSSPRAPRSARSMAWRRCVLLRRSIARRCCMLGGAAFPRATKLFRALSAAAAEREGLQPAHTAFPHLRLDVAYSSGCAGAPQRLHHVHRPVLLRHLPGTRSASFAVGRLLLPCGRNHWAASFVLPTQYRRKQLTDTHECGCMIASEHRGSINAGVCRDRLPEEPGQGRQADGRRAAGRRASVHGGAAHAEDLMRRPLGSRPH